MRSFFRFFFLALLFLFCCLSPSARAQTTTENADQPNCVQQLDQQTEEWIEQCRHAVLDCQLEDGAIVAVGYREVGRPALVNPYFSHLAACGILAAEQRRSDPQNRLFLTRWLKWYALNQKDEDILIFDGQRGPNGLANVTTRPVDSLDSAAALYLYVAGRTSKLTKTGLDPDVTAACLRMLTVLERCHNQNDLYWNYPQTTTSSGNPHAEDLLDNIEVYQGLSEISDPLAAAGHPDEARQARDRAASLSIKLAQFWSSKYSYYVCMFGDIAADVPFGAQPLYANGLATVSALALLDNVPDCRRQALWVRLQDMYRDALKIGYNTQNYDLEDPTIERVYLAALRSAPKEDQQTPENDLAHQRELLNTRVAALLERNIQLGTGTRMGDPFPYCHRFALMLIALASPQGRPTPYLPAVPLPR